MFELSAELLRFLNLLSGMDINLLYFVKHVLMMMSVRVKLQSKNKTGELLGDEIVGIRIPPDEQSCLVSLEGYQRHDPLLNSSWLRSCVVSEGKAMLAAGCLKDLSDMFELLALNIVKFMNEHWVLDKTTIGSVFEKLHSQFAVPFARYPRPLPKGESDKDVDAMLAGVAGHPRLLYQLKQLGGVTSEIHSIASSKPHIITPAQLHLILVPQSLIAVRNARQVCSNAGCSDLVFLLSLMLLDIPSLISQVSSHTKLIQALKSPEILGPNVGYTPLIQWLDKRRMEELRKLL